MKGITANAFETKAGWSPSTIYNLNKGIRTDKLAQAAEAFPDLNIRWLITGEESPVYENPYVSDSALPLVPIEAVAGYGTPAYDDIKVEDYYSVGEFRDNSDFLLRVKGDSMAPKFTGGDIVACKKIESRLFFQWGRVYAICTESQGVMIKRVQPSEDKDCIRCVSDNEKYAPFDVPKSDIIALALVNGSISLE